MFVSSALCVSSYRTITNNYMPLANLTWRNDGQFKSKLSIQDRDDWKYVAMVVDRLLLLVFFGVTLGGTLGIICSAPHVFDFVDQEQVMIIRNCSCSIVKLASELLAAPCTFTLAASGGDAVFYRSKFKNFAHGKATHAARTWLAIFCLIYTWRIGKALATRPVSWKGQMVEHQCLTPTLVELPPAFKI